MREEQRVRNGNTRIRIEGFLREFPEDMYEKINGRADRNKRGRQNEESEIPVTARTYHVPIVGGIPDEAVGPAHALLKEFPQSRRRRGMHYRRRAIRDEKSLVLHA